MADALAVLEFRAATRLGDHGAAGEVVDWLRARNGETAEVVLMRAWAEAACGSAHRGPGRGEHSGGRRSPRWALLVEIHLLEAEAALHEGDDHGGTRGAGGGRSHLGRALDLVRPFVEAGVRTRGVLCWAPAGRATPFGARIAAACAVGAGGHQPCP